ncbi:hypothetical protein B0T25DRAFT_505739 [Lasiosphaeria hispida]|uniref:BTB domain-containing protein n=1 Tax=Lasiosphaeria hispida TaxID=260671 RepID=A0AAJ0MD60_9PEZI|nr:hypothetical protein B0T25DRAFT_505739 [Lasiosphaeria hispida]
MPPLSNLSSIFGTSWRSHYTLSDSSDTVLTLKNPTALFAVWDEPDGVASTQSPANSSSNTPVVFRVSSQNLIQASHWFKTALTGSWTENSDRSVSAEGWDPEAMDIVLRAVHNRTGTIPRKVTLEMLCKIAVLVDYYGLHDALHFFCAVWIDLLRNPLPTVYGRDLILWICISSIFASTDILNIVKKVAIEHNTGEVRTLGLPISQCVINDVDTRRAAELERHIASLNLVKRNLLNGTAGCSFECRSILLGAIVQYMHNEGVEDFMRLPFKGCSVVETTKKIQEIHSPSRDWHKPTLSRSSSCSFSLSSLIKAAYQDDDDNWGFGGLINGKGKKEGYKGAKKAWTETSLEDVWGI